VVEEAAEGGGLFRALRFLRFLVFVDGGSAGGFAGVAVLEPDAGEPLLSLVAVERVAL